MRIDFEGLAQDMAELRAEWAHEKELAAWCPQTKEEAEAEQRKLAQEQAEAEWQAQMDKEFEEHQEKMYRQWQADNPYNPYEHVT